MRTEGINISFGSACLHEGDNLKACVLKGTNILEPPEAYARCVENVFVGRGHPEGTRILDVFDIWRPLPYMPGTLGMCFKYWFLTVEYIMSSSSACSKIRVNPNSHT